MPMFEVIYSLGNKTPSSSFQAESTMQYQKMSVEASSGTNAQRIVESMFGGPNQCLVHSAWQKMLP